MKKLTSIMLVLAMLASAAAMTACGGEETPVADAPAAGTEDTTAEETEASAAEEAPAVEEVVEEEPAAEEVVEEEPVVEEPVEEEPVEEEPVEEEPAGPVYLLEQMETYHYITHYCPYTDGAGTVGGGAAGGFFDEASDEMAMFIAENPEWYKDTALMASWEEAEGPFGDCIDKMIAADTDFVNDQHTNGLMVYKTFNVENYSADNLYELYCFYDNTVYIYINGELFYFSDANCGNGDWNGGYDLISCNTADDKDLGDFLKEGENYIAISIKNCWGGRELDLYMTCTAQ